MTTPTNGGYDCNFVDNPPDELVCQICTLVALHPYQTTCCGRVYCKRCMENYREQNHEMEKKFHCPNCRKRTQTFYDKRGSRNINFLRVKCSHIQYGCYWEGELLYLEDHVAQCGYCQIPCPNSCSIMISRANVDSHLKNECPQRKYRCQDCNKLGTYYTIVTKHQEECPEAVIPCPNGCGFVPIVRKLLESHRMICPNQTVACHYHHLGCTASIIHKDLPFHKSQFLEHHLDLAVKQISKLKFPIATFKLRDFASLKSAKKWWYSPGFYTSRGGYKLCIGVMVSGNGDGAGTHVSAYIYRMKGEHDENLMWPFRGRVTFDLLNQLEDSSHMRRVVPFEFQKTNKFNSRVLKGERSEHGWGFNRLVSHDSLIQTHDTMTKSHDSLLGESDPPVIKPLVAMYVKEDSMYFRIVSAEVYSSNRPWLVTTC